jgi:cellulose synthase operon protein YhjQ
MLTITVSGMHGGVGATAIVANLSAALQQQGLRCLCIDANADNMLRLALAVNPEETLGWAKSSLTDSAWQDATLQHEDGRWVLPFGELNVDELAHFIPTWASSESLLHDIFSELQSLPLDCVVIDGPHSRLLPLYSLPSVDLTLYVAAPDAASYALLKQDAKNWQSPNSRILINRVQPAQELASAITSFIADDFEAQMAPCVVHEDLIVAEAQAELSSVVGYAPGSQAAQDFQSLALWCQSELQSREK